MSTTIDASTLKKIQLHLEAMYPHEACGFLLGMQSPGKREINLHIEAENISTENQRRRFVIHPLEYLRAEKVAASNGLDLLGIYHSHPDHPAIPSIHDVEYAQPFFSYFIHAILGGKMTDTRSYRLLNHRLEEEVFAITKPSIIK